MTATIASDADAGLTSIDEVGRAAAARPGMVAGRRELGWHVWVAAAVLGGIVVCLFLLMLVYAVPGHPGNDQEGYLLTARLMVDQHTLGFTPAEPYQFVGLNCVVTDAGRAYAKYPIGFPVLAAIVRGFGGIDAVYLVNPVCFALVCLMSFWLFRTITSNFLALLGVIWLACDPATLYFAFDTNSHAPTMLCAVVGFWGLLRWWKTGRKWIGFVGGFALGYAAIIRYTEFLLVVPLLFAILAAADFRPWRLHRNLMPLLGWAIPILVMGCICWRCFGSPWHTGYYLDHEQSGFGLKYLIGEKTPAPPRTQGNLETFFTQFNHIGLPFIWPVWIVGMLAMLGRNWRVATLLTLWIVPMTILYLCYYWAPIGQEYPYYMRFFLPAFPGMILCALWVCDRASRSLGRLTPIALGAITAASCVLNLANTLPSLENQMEEKLSLHIMHDQLKLAIPPNQGNVIIADQQVANYLDSLGGYHLFEPMIFRTDAFQQLQGRLNNTNNDEPYALQRSRLLVLMHLAGNEQPDGKLVPKSPGEIDQMESDAITKALDESKRVAIIIRGKNNLNEVFRDERTLSARLMTTWKDIPPLPRGAAGVFPIWNTGVQIQFAPDPNPGSWRVYEITRKKMPDPVE